MQAIIKKPMSWFLQATPLSGKLAFVRYEHPILFFLTLGIIVLAISIFLTGILFPAFAEENLDAMLPKNWPSELYKASTNNLENLTSAGITDKFSSLLGKNSGAYDAIKTVHGTVIKPVATSIIAIVFLVGCFDVANRFENAGVLGPFKEVVFLLIGAAICIAMVKQSLTFCQEIFDMFSTLASSVMGIDGASSFGKDSFKEGMTDDIINNIANGWFVKFFVALIYWLMTLVAVVVTYFSVIGRAVQALVYAAVSPIAIAFLGNEHTRQWGIGFIKAFVALGLAGVIMAMMILLTPLAIKSTSGDGLLSILTTIAVMAVFIKGMCSAGSWAKEILGG